MDAVLNWLGQAFNYLWDFIKDVLLWFPKKLFSLLIDGLIALLEVMPDPCCISEAVSAFQWLSSMAGSLGLGYIFGLVDFNYGFRVILCAYVARFILRRIPVIG